MGLAGTSTTLPTGAEVRLSGVEGPLAVVCANGGQAAEVPGTWSASIEWLVRGLAPRFPDLRFAEVRYRVKSWNRLDLCVEDVLAAIGASRAQRVLLMGFSMGGAVSVRAAAHPAVVGVLGLAPWLPDELDRATPRPQARRAARRARPLAPRHSRCEPGAHDVATSGRGRSASTARTPLSRAPCTRSRSGLRRVVSSLASSCELE